MMGRVGSALSEYNLMFYEARHDHIQSAGGDGRKLLLLLLLGMP